MKWIKEFWDSKKGFIKRWQSKADDRSKLEPSVILKHKSKELIMLKCDFRENISDKLEDTKEKWQLGNKVLDNLVNLCYNKEVYNNWGKRLLCL